MKLSLFWKGWCWNLNTTSARNLWTYYLANSTNFDSWWLPVTTSGAIDTVLSRPAFHCTLTQLSGSVHTDRAQPKVCPACLSKLTISLCATGFQIVSWDDETCANVSILYVCCKLLQSDFISGAKRVHCVKRHVAGVCSCMCQAEGGIDHVTEYSGRVLRKGERNYGITDLEALAVIEGFAKYHPYLYGNFTTVVTDHAALVYMKNNIKTRGRLGRWALSLSNYNYEVVHRPGAKQGNADALSRLGNYDTSEPPEEPMSTDQPDVCTISLDNQLDRGELMAYPISDDFRPVIESVMAIQNVDITKLQADCPQIGPICNYIKHQIVPDDPAVAKHVIAHEDEYGMRQRPVSCVLPKVTEQGQICKRHTPNGVTQGPQANTGVRVPWVNSAWRPPGIWKGVWGSQTAVLLATNVWGHPWICEVLHHLPTREERTTSSIPTTPTTHPDPVQSVAHGLPGPS